MSRFARVCLVVFIAVAPLTANRAAHASGADLDCADFGTKESAQRFLNDHPADEYGLDADSDGQACEWRPSGNLFGGIGSYVAAFAALAVVQTRSQQRRPWKFETFFAVALMTSLLGLPGFIVAYVAPGALPRQVSALAIAGISGGVSVAVVSIWAAKFYS